MAIKNPYSPLVIPGDWKGTMRNFGTQLAGIITDIYLKLTKQKEEAVTKSDVANNLTTSAEGSVLDARQGKVLNDKFAAMEIKTWTPKLYDLDTYKRDMPSSYYFKVGGLYVMMITISNFNFSGVSTMIQIRNLPCAYCLGGTVFLQGLTSTAKDANKGLWIQGTQVSSAGVAYVRENVISSDFVNASTGSQVAEFVLFGI